MELPSGFLKMVNGGSGMSDEQRREAVLNRWAKRDVGRAIASDLGIPTLRALYKIIEAARAMNDPRAMFKKGRLTAGRAVETKRREGRRLRQSVARPVYEDMGFGVATVFVTCLGAGSINCVRVPVSISTNLKISQGA
jgi:hypothetical protein